MIRKLKRIAPLQFGLVLGALYALLSLVFVPFLLLFAVAARSLPQNAAIFHPALQQQMPGLQQQTSALPSQMAGFLTVFSFAMVIILPIAYGVLGFIGGVIAAFLYNIVAKIVGGIEIEVE